MRKEVVVLEKHCDWLLTLPNVVGVGIGKKVRDGEIIGELAVVVLVTHKVTRCHLTPESMIPAELDGVETDVIAVGEPKLLGNMGKT